MTRFPITSGLTSPARTCATLGFSPWVAPRIAPRGLAHAWRQVHAWLEVEVVWIPQPTERHRDVLAMLLTTAGVQANLVPDAHLAALAIEHGLLLCSTDGDFGRFTDLRWQNPLAGTGSRRQVPR